MVNQHQVGLHVSDLAHGFLSASGLDELYPNAIEGKLYHPLHGGAIVGNEDPGFHGALLFAPWTLIRISVVPLQAAFQLAEFIEDTLASSPPSFLRVFLPFLPQKTYPPPK